MTSTGRASARATGRCAVSAAALAGLVLVAAACGGGGGSGDAAGGGGRSAATAPTTAPGAVGAAPAPASPRTVPAAFRFSAPALDGGRVEGADYASTGVALWFWAPW